MPRPHRRIPTRLMLVFSEAASFYLSRFHPSFPQRFTPGAIRLLQKRRHADIDKARRELGYQPTSIRAAVHDAYAFHYHRNAITNPLAKRPRVNATEQVENLIPNQDIQMPSVGGSK